MAKENPLINLRKGLKEKKYERLYVFYGEEVYLKELYIKKLLELVPNDGFEEFNRIIIDSKEASLSEVADTLEGFPMMSDRRVILIENSGIFKSAAQEAKDFYTKAFEKLSEDTILIFSETEIDKRSVLYKAAAKKGMVVNFETLSFPDVVAFVQREVKELGGSIQKDTAEYLVNICDSGLSSVKNEILKLVSANKEITKTDIDRLTSKSLQIKVFDLCDFLMEGKTEEALKLTEDLKTVKESPFKLLYILFGTFDKMLKARLSEKEGIPYRDIVSELGVSPFIAKKYIKGAGAFSEEELILMVTKAAETDLAIKQGRVDEWTAFEDYINEFLRYIKEK